MKPITRAVLEKVIDLRAQYSIKIPDAIHIVTGILACCDLFVTADQAWAKTGVTVVDPAEVGGRGETVRPDYWSRSQGAIPK